MKRLKNRSGFTLTELIVVLVILALLAAFMIPALTGYIKKARAARSLSEGRAVRIALQSICSQATADGVDCSGGLTTVVNYYGDDLPLSEAAMKFAAINDPDAGFITAEINSDNAVVSFSYLATDGYTVVFENGEMNAFE